MDLDLARTFLEIANTGSFVRAAERLNVTQSTITMRVQRLEEMLGHELFKRGRSGAMLTLAGLRFRPHAESLIRTWRQALQDLALPSGFKSIVAFGAEHALWSELVMPWLVDFRARHTEIAVRAMADGAEKLQRDLYEGRLDFALLYSWQSRVGFTVDHLCDEELVLVSTEKRNRMRWDPNYIEVDWGDELRSEIVNYYSVDETPALTVNLSQLAIDYLRSTKGSVHVPLRVAKYLEEQQICFRVGDTASFNRSIYIAYPSPAPDQNKLDLVVSDIRKYVQKETVQGVAQQ